MSSKPTRSSQPGLAVLVDRHLGAPAADLPVGAPVAEALVGEVVGPSAPAAPPRGALLAVLAPGLGAVRVPHVRLAEEGRRVVRRGAHGAAAHDLGALIPQEVAADWVDVLVLVAHY